MYEHKLMGGYAGVIKFKASFTVENSVVMPMFFITVVMLIVVCMYIHDNVVIKNAALQGCIKNEFYSEIINTDDINADIDQYIKSNILLLRNEDVHIESDKNKYKVCFKYMKEISVEKNRPADFLRIINAVKKFGNR